MIIKLNSLISILLTTMLVFNYAIGNIVYATESNQSSTQNQDTQELLIHKYVFLWQVRCLLHQI